jgi:hypothetical protein
MNRSLLLIFCAVFFLALPTQAQTLSPDGVTYLSIPVSGTDLKKLIKDDPDYPIPDKQLFMLVIVAAPAENNDATLRLQVPDKNALSVKSNGAPAKIMLNRAIPVVGGTAYVKGEDVHLVWRVNENGRRISAFRAGEIVRLTWVRL